MRQNFFNFIQFNGIKTERPLYNFGLTVEPHFLVAAAARCQFACSALLFVDISQEERHRTSASSNKPDQPSLYSDQVLNRLLIAINKNIHDPDAIYGVDLYSSLELQAIMYEHKGNWMEALSIYESILQSGITNSFDKERPEMGIGRSLQGLGAKLSQILLKWF